MSFSSLTDVLLHLNLYVGELINQYHGYAYLILMLIIFCETGLIVALFLPGDSLLFATGLFFAASDHSIWPIIWLLVLAAFLGDNSNYWIGRLFGRKLFVAFPNVFKEKYLVATEGFYQRHGAKAILFARYLPFFRTFIPFFGGVSKMHYGLYMALSLLSAIIWVNLLVLLSYYFGNIPFVQNNFSLVIVIIILISITPAIYHFIQGRLAKRRRNKV